MKKPSPLARAHEQRHAPHFRLSLHRLRHAPRGLAQPPGRQHVHRVVVHVQLAHGVRVVELDAGAVVLGPVGDAALGVVAGVLERPPEADDAGRLGDDPAVAPADELADGGRAFGGEGAGGGLVGEAVAGEEGVGEVEYAASIYQYYADNAETLLADEKVAPVRQPIDG